MLYPYITLSDGTEILHSQIINQDGIEKIEVHFERPEDDGFAIARCILPEYDWVKCEKFTDEEMKLLKKLTENNASLMFKYARLGGIKIA